MPAAQNCFQDATEPVVDDVEPAIFEPGHFGRSVGPKQNGSRHSRIGFAPVEHHLGARSNLSGTGLPASAARALRQVLKAQGSLTVGLDSWRRGPSSSGRVPRVDDATNAALAELCVQLMSIRDAALGCLNEQTVQSEDGDAECANAWLQVVHDASPELEIRGPTLMMNELEGQESLDIGAGSSVIAQQQRARRAAVQDAQSEWRLIGRLSLNAAERHRQLQLQGLDNFADGRVVVAELKLRAKLVTVVKVMAPLLLKATLVSAVGSAQVILLWWLVNTVDGAEERFVRAVCTVTGTWGIGVWATSASMLLQSARRTCPAAATVLRALSLLVPWLLPLFVWAMYFGLGGDVRSVSAYAVSGTIVLVTGPGLTFSAFHIGNTIRARPEVEASRNAVVALQELGASHQGHTRSKRKTAMFAIKNALPFLLGAGTAGLYVFGIFAAYREAAETWQKALVYFFALLVKVGCNKATLLLMQRLPNMEIAFADDAAFFGEYTTALLCRVLVLSMPDLNTAQLLSVTNSLIELGVRNLFLVKHLVAGMRLEADDDRTKWGMRGLWRTMDGNNDNVPPPAQPMHSCTHTRARATHRP